MTEQIDYDPNTVLEALNNKADRDLNNVTDGTYQVLTTKNITNCLTKIPQDIKFELNNGILTTKAGLKVYVPNGFELDGVTKKFDELIIPIDRVNSSDSTSIRRKLQFINPNLLEDFPRVFTENCYSGETAPSGASYMFWYDTNNNLGKLTTDGGTSWDTGYSLPYMETTENDSEYTSIDQVFNGFGYIGSTIFALPGIEGLIPNGRNIDGSLNNTKFTTSSVLSRTYGSNETYADANLIISSSQFTTNYMKYYNDKNLNIDSLGREFSYVSCGIASFVNGRITSFNPKTTFQAIDRNDTEEIINWGMPDYTAGVSVSAYTSSSNQFVAPCAGFINVVYLAQASNSACPHIGNKTFGSYNEGAIADNVTLLISEGETFYCTGMYANKGNGSNMFYPMKGAV